MDNQRRVEMDSLDEAIQNHLDGASNSHGDFNILITGFGPFKEQYPVNPSYEIAARLPSSTSISDSLNKKINLFVHHPAIRVNYDTVRTITPQLYDGRRIDFTLHIGMAGSRHYYSIESQAHKRGYTSADVDGKLCSYANDGRKLVEVPKAARKMDRNVDEAKTSDEQMLGEQTPELLKASVRSGYTNEIGDQTPSPSDLRAQREAKEAAEAAQNTGVGERFVEDWTTLPEVLYPGVDVQRVLRSWDAEMKTKIDLRVSNDAGRYLCEYIYWCNLAHHQLSGQGTRKVLFLHVPGNAEEDDIAEGVEVVLALCKAIVYEMIDGGAGKLELVQVDDKSREDERTDDKTNSAAQLDGVADEYMKADVTLTSIEKVKEDVKGKLKRNEEGMVIDTEENSDEYSDDDDPMFTPNTAAGEMDEEDKDIKGEVHSGMYPEGRSKRGVRGHTNRNKNRKPVTRWPDLQEKTKTKKVAERAEAEARAAAEGHTEDQRGEKEKKSKSKGKGKEEKTGDTITSERVVIDKEYLGYVMVTPKDGPVSD